MPEVSDIRSADVHKKTQSRDTENVTFRKYARPKTPFPGNGVFAPPLARPLPGFL